LGNITKQPYMKSLNFKVNEDLKNTYFITENTFWTELYPGLSKIHLEYYINKIKSLFKV
jgi:CDP-4-dehydro-6-deoxyglucose reductase, E1